MFEIKGNPSLCQRINQIQLQLVYYGRAKVDTKWKGTARNPINTRLMYIVSGTGYIQYGKNRIMPLRTGYWYLIPAGCSFSYACDDCLDHIYFHLRMHDVDGMDLFHQHSTPHEMAAPRDDVAFFTNGLDCKTVAQSLQIRHRIEELLLSFISTYGINLEYRNLSYAVNSAVRCIRENLSVQLSCGDIARFVNVSQSTLEKRFKKELSMSVRSYIDHLVFSEAARLLRQTDLSVSDISEQFGFCDQFYFSRRFKEKMGTPPKNYRKTFL